MHSQMVHGMNDYADRAWAKQFYGSQAWQNCRRDYRKARAGLCERCLARGLIVPGTQVHHKIALTPQNITDPSITLNWENLVLLCKSCHDAEHTQSRFQIGPDGELIIK